MRTNWKSYGYKIDEDPTQADSSESEYGSQAGSEEQDEVNSIETPSKKAKDSDFDDSDKDN